MAGAFYGLDAIDPAWRRSPWVNTNDFIVSKVWSSFFILLLLYLNNDGSDLGRWDAGEIELRAVCLFLTPTLSDLPYPADSTSASSNFCDSTDSCLPCVTM